MEGLRPHREPGPAEPRNHLASSIKRLDVWAKLTRTLQTSWALNGPVHATHWVLPKFQTHKTMTGSDKKLWSQCSWRLQKQSYPKFGMGWGSHPGSSLQGWVVIRSQQLLGMWGRNFATRLGKGGKKAYQVQIIANRSWLFLFYKKKRDSRRKIVHQQSPQLPLWCLVTHN